MISILCKFYFRRRKSVTFHFRFVVSLNKLRIFKTIKERKRLWIHLTTKRHASSNHLKTEKEIKKIFLCYFSNWILFLKVENFTNDFIYKYTTSVLPRISKQHSTFTLPLLVYWHSFLLVWKFVVRMYNAKRQKNCFTCILYKCILLEICKIKFKWKSMSFDLLEVFDCGSEILEIYAEFGCVLS